MAGDQVCQAHTHMCLVAYLPVYRSLTNPLLLFKINSYLNPQMTLPSGQSQGLQFHPRGELSNAADLGESLCPGACFPRFKS